MATVPSFGEPPPRPNQGKGGLEAGSRCSRPDSVSPTDQPSEPTERPARPGSAPSSLVQGPICLPLESLSSCWPVAPPGRLAPLPAGPVVVEFVHRVHPSIPGTVRPYTTLSVPLREKNTQTRIHTDTPTSHAMSGRLPQTNATPRPSQNAATERNPRIQIPRPNPRVLTGLELISCS